MSKTLKRGDNMRFDSPMWAIYVPDFDCLLKENGEPMIFSTRKAAAKCKEPGDRLVRLRIEGVIQ